MTEVEYGGGGTAHGWNRSTDQLVCLEVPPAPVYKGARGEAAGQEEGRAKGGVLLPVGVGLLMERAIGGRPPPPPPLLYIRGGGHPLETQQLIIDLLAVCGAPLHHIPPRSYRSDA